MKLLFVMNSAKYFILNRLPLARHIIDAGFEVYAAVCFDDDDSVTKIEKAGIHCLPFYLERRSFNPISGLESLRQLNCIFREVNPDIVHSWTIKSLILSGILCRRHHIPLVAMITGRGVAFRETGIRGWILRHLASTLYRHAFNNPLCTVCFQNHDDREYFEKGAVCSSNQTHYVGSGVDIHRFSYVPIDIETAAVNNVLMVARMLKDKGVIEFLDACKQVKQHFPSASFTLVGAPDPGNPNSFYAKQLIQLCRASGANWLGYTRDIANTLAGCDIFCLPSYSEGLPMTLLQAAAMGRALIATDIPGCHDIVKHNETGILVPPRDTDALAEAIMHLLDTPEKCRSLGGNAREKAENIFRQELHHERFIELYRRLLQENPRYVAKEASQNNLSI